MREAVSRWAFYTCCAVNVALIWAIDAFGAANVWDAISGSTAASWVQAVGSIAALAGAAGVMLWQHRLQQRADRAAALEGELAWTKSVQTLFALADFKVQTMQRHLGSADHWMHYSIDIHPNDHVATLADALELVSPREGCDPMLFFLLLTGRKAYRECSDAVADALRDGGYILVANTLSALLHEELRTIQAARVEFEQRMRVLEVAIT